MSSKKLTCVTADVTCSESIATVSYTHLDVYKRQVVRSHARVMCVIRHLPSQAISQKLIHRGNKPYTSDVCNKAFFLLTEFHDTN